MKRLMSVFSLLFLPVLGYSQQSSKSPKREITWIYDVTIIRDPAGKAVKVEKKVFCKGTPGAPSKIRYFETKEQRDASGNLKFSTTERVGENNVDPEIVKQYGGN